jgi:hypothetical protein
MGRCVETNKSLLNVLTISFLHTFKWCDAQKKSGIHHIYGEKVGGYIPSGRTYISLSGKQMYNIQRIPKKDDYHTTRDPITTCRREEKGLNPYHDRTCTLYPQEGLIEGVNQSAATTEYVDESHTNLSFCGMVHIPHGFTYVPKGTKKLAYSLSGLSVVKETSQKSIVVEDCGPVDVTLNVLKVVGNIPYIVTAKVQGDDGEMYGSSSKQANQIDLSYTGSIPVDTVLKLSVASLPNYQLHEQNINISDFQVTPVQDQGASLLRFTGTLVFHNIPQ